MAFWPQSSVIVGHAAGVRRRGRVPQKQGYSNTIFYPMCWINCDRQLIAGGTHKLHNFLKLILELTCELKNLKNLLLNKYSFKNYKLNNNKKWPVVSWSQRECH
jgi:hypothetical protein